ncbi:MAG: TonB-dependent receptor plug domain-containing protein, partial [Alistipes sp.]|nr:TonB-dependent receptor plug domain-containing protein [Alistipes sp.]
SQQLIDFGMNYVGQREYVGYDSKISGEQLMATGCTDILSALSGLIPGVSVTENFETGTYTVSIRSGGFHENGQPLFVVDEVIVPSIDHIQLNQVAYVIVMKDAAVYGFRGGNGAIVVRTKSAELMSASEGKINSYQD